jgi:hypothetical protein
MGADVAPSGRERPYVDPQEYLADVLPRHTGRVRLKVLPGVAAIPVGRRAGRCVSIAALTRLPRPPLGLKSELRGSCGFGRTLTR